MATRHLLSIILFSSIFFSSSSSSSSSSPLVVSSEDYQESYISAVISERGLVFAKDLLVDAAVKALMPLSLPDFHSSMKIPLIGSVRTVASNITLYSMDITSSVVQPGDTGVVIVASGVSANLRLNWVYSYSTWLFPFGFTDKGGASVQVEGMEVGLTMMMENKGGALSLTIIQCDCFMTELLVKLDGGASWFYQGFVDVLEDHLMSAMETAITQRIKEEASKLDSLLKAFPKNFDVDKVASLNVTFVNDPLFRNSSIEFEINGLIISSDKVPVPSYLPAPSFSSLFSRLSSYCDKDMKMLWISLDEAVFDSASRVYYKAGIMHWIVDRIPEQALLNTAYWMFIIPQLYLKYPNHDMLLNVSLTSPPVMRIASKNIMAAVNLDMMVLVLDGSRTVPVLCVSVVVSVSGTVKILGNNLAGQAGLDSFSLALKWSDVGNFPMSLIQGVVRIFLNTIFVPYVNTILLQGFPLPIIHGFTLKDATIVSTNSMIAICSDLVFDGSFELMGSRFQKI